jgi:hypothetical protein
VLVDTRTGERIETDVAGATGVLVDGGEVYYTHRP